VAVDKSDGGDLQDRLFGAVLGAAALEVECHQVGGVPPTGYQSLPPSSGWLLVAETLRAGEPASQVGELVGPSGYVVTGEGPGSRTPQWPL
jgi:hypothetical protein